MAEERAKRTDLLEEQAALMDYLDALLGEVPNVEPPAPVPPVPVPDTTRAAVPPVPAVSQLAVEGGAPDWGRDPFPCLLFRVGGLKLAVPLVKLNGVVAWTDDITPMPGHQPWNLGLLRHLDHGVKVVDTLRIVMPEERWPRVAGSPRQIILIDEHRWGLACDSVEETIALHPEDVRWRTARTRRPWLAGTVVRHMCAILDVDALAATLASGDWLHH